MSGRCLRDKWKLFSGFLAFRWSRRMWHWEDSSREVLAFERVQQGQFALSNGTRRRLVNLHHKVEPDGFALDRPFHVREGVPGITVARPLH